MNVGVVGTAADRATSTPIGKPRTVWSTLTLRDAALKLGFVTVEQFDEWVRPEDMTHPLREREGDQRVCP
jgi:hypothetical protein